jgi:hypothetical protein
MKVKEDEALPHRPTDKKIPRRGIFILQCGAAGLNAWIFLLHWLIFFGGWRNFLFSSLSGF